MIRAKGRNLEGMGQPTLLLADDYRPLLDYLTKLLSAEFEIVAAVGDGQSAFDAASVLQPDVVVFDISMPVVTGLEAAAGLAHLEHPPRVVFLTIHEDADYMEAAFKAGALGYVLKRRLTTDLVSAIHEALAGRSFVSPPLSADEQVRPSLS
jgi:DNA-binding NarL/FixJ family response regulator